MLSVSDELRNDKLRIITVSRARYNPRFRGRLVIDPRAVTQTLVHVALCVSTSYPYDMFNLKAGEARTRRREDRKRATVS